MAITVPKDGDIISASAFGIPVANEINRITPITTVTAWTNLTLLNSWATSGGAFNLAYRKIGDIVYTRGNVGTGAVGSIIATLPAGFRPLTSLYLASSIFVGSTWVVACVWIQPDGSFTYHPSSPANPAYLDCNFVFSTI